MSKFLDDIPDLGMKHRKKRRLKQPDPENVVVKYTRIRCPKCRSYRVPVYDSAHVPIRYHKCSDCAFRFKSIEVEFPGK